MNSTEEIIDDIRQGKMVIILDDEDRENEGDLIMAASAVRPEDINFMARYGRGLVCLTLTRERCEQLNLPLMVSGTDAKHATNFTLSIEATKGITTGISAADRATTVQAAIAADAKPSDISQPGHIFPVMAQPGGVLARAGHTEGGCDFARLAGLEPAAVIVEILNDDGSMARRPDLELFAKQHNLKMGTIADLIHYRTQNEKTVEKVAECPFETEFATFKLTAYRDNLHQALHFALTLGDITKEQPTLVRVHIQDSLTDILGLLHEKKLALRTALQCIADEGHGVLVLLRLPENENELIKRIQNIQLDCQGINLPTPPVGEDLRLYGLGAQILNDLGVGKMRILGSQKKLHGLSGFGLEVTEYIK